MLLKNTKGAWAELGYAGTLPGFVASGVFAT